MLLDKYNLSKSFKTSMTQKVIQVYENPSSKWNILLVSLKNSGDW